MPVEILVVAIGSTHADPDKDRRGSWKRGDLVAAMPGGHIWENGEVPPKFVRLHCSTVEPDQVQPYIQHWYQLVDYVVVSQNHTTGVYQLRIYCTQRNASGLGGLTREQVEGWLTRWNCTVDSVANGEITFTVRLWPLIQSEGFWGRPTNNVVFTLNVYDPATGRADVSADYSGVAGNPDPAEVETWVENRGGTITSHASRVIRFELQRAAVIALFRDEVKSAVEQIFYRRRYNFAALVPAAEAAGGTLDVTTAQLLSAAHDRLGD